MFNKTKEGCKFGEKCSYAHLWVDEYPGKRSPKNGDKSAVAMLKVTRQLGCVFQDMEPPRSSPILWKSSNMLKPIRCELESTRKLGGDFGHVLLQAGGRLINGTGQNITQVTSLSQQRLFFQIVTGTDFVYSR